ncbi:MAG: response regulator [Pseudomonadota bacterium]
MLVDTNTMFMENLGEKIKGSAFKVFAATSGSQALSTLVKKKIDVVVLNMKELHMDGIHILSDIKKVRPLTEVVLLRAPSGIHLSIEGMKRGAFDDLLLPPDIGDLRRIIGAAGMRKREKEKEDKRKRKRRSIVRALEDIAVSATYAEAGEFETAREIFKRRKKEK